MPPPTSRDTACLRGHWPLLLALGASAVLHVAATLGTLGWSSVRERREIVPFTATLSPMAAVASTSTAISVKPLRTPAAPRLARPRATRILPTARSEATFVAPENAIAMQRPTPGDEMEPRAPDGDMAGGVGETPTAPLVAATAHAAPEMQPAVAEKPATTDAPVPVPELVPATELPSRVSIAYRATTSIADGIAYYKWKRDGEKYEFVSTIQAEGFFVNMFAGTITQESRGTVTPRGLEPAWFTIRRGDGAAETAEFQRATQQVKLSRGSESRQLPMPPNLQDTQSFLFQLAIEAAKLKTTEDRLVILVTNARGLNSYTFKKVGESTLETRLGAVETVHLVRETSEPRDSYEAWLSPKHYYLPLKLKFFVDRFPAELIATNITSTP